MEQALLFFSGLGGQAHWYPTPSILSTDLSPSLGMCRPSILLLLEPPSVFKAPKSSHLMSACDSPIADDSSDVGSSSLHVCSPRATAPGSPEILVPSSSYEPASPALSYANMPPSEIMSLESALVLEFSSSKYFPSALPDKMAFGRDLSKPLALVIMSPWHDPINHLPTSHSTLLYTELERAKSAQKKPPVSGFRKNPRTRAPTPIAA